jgi:hypothetical protein
MRELIAAASAFAVFAGAASAFASDPLVLPGGEEGCISPAGDTCTYTATRTGGYAANGSTWSITVQIPANGDPRDTNGDGKLRYVFTSANAPDEGCGFFAAGSTVTTNGGSGSDGVAAGNPFPAASDGPIGSSNDCSTGIVSASNPNYTPVD